MGCGCIHFSNNKNNIISNLNQSTLNFYTLSEKEIKTINNKNKSSNDIVKFNFLNLKSDKKSFNKNNSNKSLHIENNDYIQKEDFSEYHLLLGNDIESLTMRKEIFISCKNLSYFNRSFGYYIIIEKKEENLWSYFSQTEVSLYTSNPSFIKSFIINYNYKDKKKEQIFKFTANYIDKYGKTFQLGSIEINLHNLFSSKNQEIALKLKDKGEIIIRGEDKRNISEFVQMRIGIKGERMTNNKIFCKISRKINNKEEFCPFYITEEKEHIYEKNEKVFYWKFSFFKL